MSNVTNAEPYLDPVAPRKDHVIASIGEYTNNASIDSWGTSAKTFRLRFLGPPKKPARLPLHIKNRQIVEKALAKAYDRIRQIGRYTTVQGYYDKDPDPSPVVVSVVLHDVVTPNRMQNVLMVYAPDFRSNAMDFKKGMRLLIRLYRQIANLIGTVSTVPLSTGAFVPKNPAQKDEVFLACKIELYDHANVTIHTWVGNPSEYKTLTSPFVIPSDWTTRYG